MTIPWGRLVGIRHVYQTYRLIDPATINEFPQKDIVATWGLDEGLSAGVALDVTGEDGIITDSTTEFFHPSSGG
jgi:hypothetical protein